MLKTFIITKDAHKLDLRKRQTAELKFAPASDDEFKAIGDNLPEGYVAGWASTPDLDLYGHVVATGAFDKAIKAKGLSGPRGIKFLAQHRMDKPAGVIKVLETRNGRLWIEAELNMKISYVRDLYEASKMNGGLSFSVGFSLTEDMFEWKKDAAGDDYLLIKEGDLFEISVVTLPGNEAAEMVYIKGLEDDETFASLAEFEKALVASGMAKSRNEAHDFVTLVKKNTALFRIDPPVLAESTTKALTSIEATLARLNTMLA